MAAALTFALKVSQHVGLSKENVSTSGVWITFAFALTKLAFNTAITVTFASPVEVEV